MRHDAHTHWLPTEIIEHAHFYSPAWGDIRNQLAAMDRAEVSRSLIVYPTNDAHTKMGGLAAVARIYNDRLAEVVAKYPDRLVGAAILPVDDGEALMAEWRRATGELGFRAVSLGTSLNGVYLDDDIYKLLYREAMAQGVTLFIHPQTINPIGYERVAHPLLTPVIEFVFDTTICIGKLITSGILHDYPHLKFVFAHFGGVMPFIKERFDSVYKMLRGREIVPDLGAIPGEYLRRLYVDTSGVTSTHALMCTVEMVGASHVLWGSDYPGNADIPASMRAIEELDLSPEDKAAILGENFVSLLNWTSRRG